MIVGSLDSFVAFRTIWCWCPDNLVAWLMDRNDLLWTPRFFDEALLWCVTLVGLASIARAARLLQQMGANSGGYGGKCKSQDLSMVAQVALVPHVVTGHISLAPASIYSPPGTATGRCRVRTFTVVKPSQRRAVVASHGCSATRMTETLLAGPNVWPARASWILGDKRRFLRPSPDQPQIPIKSGVWKFTSRDYTLIDRAWSFRVLRKRK